MKKYKFRKYKKNYPRLFEKEKKRLKKTFPDIEIEHIGSTAVESLGGKGIIDILISVPKKDLKNIKDKLVKLKYSVSKLGGGKNRISFYLNKGIFKQRKIHLHLTSKNSKVHQEAIKFRDSLKKNKKLREKYSIIKQEAVKLKKKGKEYRDFKEKFIQEC